MCGGVTYRVDGPLRDVYNCHCHRCRRFTGHHMAATAADVCDVNIEDADQLLTWYRVPGAAYAFCSRCGSSLFWRSDPAPHRLSICAGTLEPPTQLTTVQAWWVSEASDYHVRPDVAEVETE
jgi:hypothetical protein